METPYPLFRVYWIPQIPMKAFYWPVYSVAEGKRVVEMLGEYDHFQYENNVKPDFSNAGGIEYFDKEDGEWYEVDEWYLGG
jgi:hypothetical protein